MSVLRISAGVAGLAVAAGLGVAALAQERVSGPEEAKMVQQERSAAMKGLGGAMRALKGFVDGRGSVADARNAAASIAATAGRIPGLFPAGTGMDALSGSEAKPDIWARWDEFRAAAAILGEKAAAMTAALDTGDSGTVGAAFRDIGGVGCGGCHRVFRQKR